MNNIFYKIIYVLKKPNIIFDKIFCIPLIPDHIVIKYQYKIKTGKKLNIANPVLYNEKLQWLKLNNKKPEYSEMIDKYEVRKFVAHTIGEEYLIPLLGVWESFDEIPFDTLPQQFVLKCTHDSGSFIICHNKDLLNIPMVRNMFNKKISRNYYWKTREWAYKNINPRIIAEKLMTDESGYELKDYKIYCFNGEPKIIQVDFNRHNIDHKVNYYSPELEYQPFSHVKQTDPEVSIPKPQCLEQMLFLAKTLSASIIHVRVDMHVINNRIYFGELTFYDWAGYGNFDPPEWDRIFGDWIILPSQLEN